MGCCAERLTVYGLSERRGQKAMNILPDFTGGALHDHWASHLAFDQGKHAFCNAHHLRELQFIMQ